MSARAVLARLASLLDVRLVDAQHLVVSLTNERGDHVVGTTIGPFFATLELDNDVVAFLGRNVDLPGWWGSEGDLCLWPWSAYEARRRVALADAVDPTPPCAVHACPSNPRSVDGANRAADLRPLLEELDANGMTAFDLRPAVMTDASAAFLRSFSPHIGRIHHSAWAAPGWVWAALSCSSGDEEPDQYRWEPLATYDDYARLKNGREA